MIICHKATDKSVLLEWSAAGATLTWSMADNITGEPFGQTHWHCLDKTPSHMPAVIDGLMPSTVYAFWLQPDGHSERPEHWFNLSTANAYPDTPDTDPSGDI